MTPHPTSVKAARAIRQKFVPIIAADENAPIFERYALQIAAAIENECHVSEMVEAATLILERFENERDKSGDTDHAFLDHCYHCWSRKMAYDLREVLAKVSHER